MTRVRILTIALLVSWLSSGWLLGAKKPAPRPQHPHAKEIADLTKQIDKLRIEERKELSGIHAWYLREVRKLDPAGERLETKLVKLRLEEWSELKKLLDIGKLNALEAKYDAKVAALQKLIRVREAKIAELTRKKAADWARVQADYRGKLAKLDDPDGKLEIKLWRLWAEERTALLKLVPATKIKLIQTKYQPDIAVLKQKVGGLDKQTGALQKQEDKEITAAKAAYQAQIAKLDSPEDSLEGELEDVLARQQAELDETTDSDAQETIKASYADEISDLQAQIKARDEQMELLQEQLQTAVADIQARYRVKTEELNPPEDRLEDRLVVLRTQQRDEIVEFCDETKAKVVIDTYAPQILQLQARIPVKQAEMARLLPEERADLAKITASYLAELAKLNRREDRAEYKIARLRTQERIELAKLLGLGKVKAIEAKYQPRIRDLIKQIAAKQRAAAALAQRARAEMNRVSARDNARIASLEKRRGELLAQRK